MLLLPPTMNNTFLMFTTLVTTMRPFTLVSNETDTTIDPFARMVKTTQSPTITMVPHQPVAFNNISEMLDTSMYRLANSSMNRDPTAVTYVIPTITPQKTSSIERNMTGQLIVPEHELKNIVLLREQPIDTASTSPFVISMSVLIVIILLAIIVRCCLQRREGLRLAYDTYNQTPNVRSIGWNSVFIPTVENTEVASTSNLDSSHANELVDLSGSISESESGFELPIVTVMPPIPPPLSTTLSIVSNIPPAPPAPERAPEQTRNNLSEANQRIQALLEEQLSSIYSSR